MDAALRQFYQQTFLPALGKGDWARTGNQCAVSGYRAGRYLQYHYIAQESVPDRREWAAC